MTAYVTGEAWLCAMVHAHLVRDRGFPAGAVRAMPYWKTKSVRGDRAGRGQPAASRAILAFWIQT